MDTHFVEFGEYKDDWLLKHPASIPMEIVEDSPYPSWARFAALAAFICSALVSGVHMMPAVYDAIPLSPIVTELMRQWVARGSFVAYELGMFMSAFLMAVQSSKRLAQVLSSIIFLTLIAVNLYSVVKVYGFDLQQNFAGTAVSTMFSLVPAIAYASGKFYINIGAAERAAERRSKENLRDDERALDATILKDYKRDKKEWEKQYEQHSVNSLNERSIAAPRSVNSLNGYTKQMNSRQVISEFFEHHPEFKNMTLDQLNEAIEQESGIRVGRTSIHNVRKEWVVSASSNGHSTLQ
jgi:hypothetical protein